MDVPDPEKREGLHGGGGVYFVLSLVPDYRLSGPVLRDTARLSQRYPPIARYGVFFLSQHDQLGAIAPPPFLRVSPHGVHAKWRCDTPPPPQKGYLSDTCAIPYKG